VPWLFSKPSKEDEEFEVSVEQEARTGTQFGMQNGDNENGQQNMYKPHHSMKIGATDVDHSTQS